MANNTEAKVSKTSKRSHMAGAFDIRNVIGSLMGLYGLVLLISYFLLDPGMDVTTGEPKNETYNLVCGLAMIAVAVVFLLWTKLDPIKIDESAAQDVQAE
ncbi:hypothetical protein [Corynebacterium macclintockiae]|uniref:hypothetical protein n=1 Tax=Corynebacterium macclintockiae TaxID=2913501 RepID=UPI0025515B50|nr:hypothetical protein [Corynebacterium macclintockiae]MDK8870499.1 hypothetical protein [Corynebacterium macclintockiae]